MIYHHSRDPYYRAPLGARPCREQIRLRIRCAPEVDRVVLRLWWDNAERLIEMQVVEHEVYEATLQLPGHPGNLWYHFQVSMNGRTRYYGNARDRLGGEGAEYDFDPPGYQITVCDPGYDTPKWMRGGILYQAMVDRFHASKPVRERPIARDGRIHADWYEPPELSIVDGDNEALDFFGGDLEGLREKLPYLRELGITALYLNPIFKARSNHKYDTGDYMQIDPSFGDEQAFRRLASDAEALDMRIILDGVFSHTGSDSRYFNREGNYDSVGAYQSPDSPYASWYRFRHWPDDYDCWWGFQTLPNVSEMEQDYLNFIIKSDDSVIAHWLRAGASGWRLDVADELPMPFLRLLRARAKAESEDACVLGEVWEDASNKVAYGEARNYTLGDTLDSCMNYPLRDALIGFLTHKVEAPRLKRVIDAMAENYPKPFFYSLMNLLGSHDKPRIISLLSEAWDMEPPRAERNARTLSDSQYALGRRRFLAGWTFLLSLPGMPSMYYADEAGAQGMSDPFCRGTYPWGREDRALLDEIRRLNAIRQSSEALRTGEMRLYAPNEHVIFCARKIEGGQDTFGQPAKDGLYLCGLNRSEQPFEWTAPADDFLPRAVKIDLPVWAAVIEEIHCG